MICNRRRFGRNFYTRVAGCSAMESQARQELEPSVEGSCYASIDGIARCPRFVYNRLD